MATCEHLSWAENPSRRPAPPGSHGCEECLQSGSVWLHLRLCLSCGHVGCCDSSPNRHATRHFEQSGHPVVRSYEPGENWAWCYEDETVGVLPPSPVESAPRHYDPPHHAWV